MQQRSSSSRCYKAHHVCYRSSAIGESCSSRSASHLDDLQDKDAALADLNKKIADLMTDGAQYQEEFTATARMRKSSGLSFLAQYLQEYPEVRRCISRTRFLTKVSHRLA
ncbi:hypothetical protein MTO96_043450 [Rhipicephalus appendiculatus]